MVLALLTLVAGLALFTGVASAGTTLGPRTTSMSLAGGTPTETTRTYCNPGGIGYANVRIKLVGVNRSNGTFALKVKDAGGVTLATFTNLNDTLDIGSFAPFECQTFTFRNSYVGTTVPATVYDIKFNPLDDFYNVIGVNARTVNASFPSGSPTEQNYTTCNTDDAYNNEIAQVSVNSASVSNGNFQLKLKEDDPDLGLVQVDTWTSAPDGYSTTATTKNGDCFAWVLRNGYVGASVPAVTYNATFYFGP